MTRPEILDAAKACVCGQREHDYGSPEDNFRVIAELWEVYLHVKCVSKSADVSILQEDVAMMMALLKIARISTGSSTEDSFVDLAGYAACGGEVATKVTPNGQLHYLRQAGHKRAGGLYGVRAALG